MKALILAAEGFEDSELQFPMYRLKEEGAEVDVAAPETGKIQGKHGYTVTPNRTLDEVSADGYDALILPGGKAPETYRLNENAVAVTKKMLEAGKPVASICHGAQMLVSTGALKGRKATCYVGVRDDVKAAGGEYSDAEVVVDGKLITSRHPGDLPAFMRELMKALKG